MVVRILAGSALVVGAIGIGFVVAMRAKYAPVQRAVRRMNRAVLNPKALETAGTPGASASIVRHRGRSSGTVYETPVGAYRADGAIFIALPYGTDTDWYRNLRAAGGGEVVHEGTTHPVGPPEVLPLSEILDLLSAGERRTFTTFKVDQVLKLPITSTVVESA